ncbi:hypothetical protein [Helicobacter equorum]|uniref:Uncharacterized protein n=1 Tax=Helicobacter equorum TaxID=361872 RepID=A0A3D8IPB7_9HELI|nr:hypothetical protein [Helicobacter equorum]RDU66454.1 hypothetical protein CQA54_07070 [Helicobacter equorum]
MAEAKILEFKEVRQIDYKEPLNVTALLLKNRVVGTFYNTLAHINNLCIEQESMDPNAFPMILKINFGGYNIEYNAFIEGFSLGFTEDTREDFMRDFALFAGQVKGKNSIPPLWLGYTLEAFGFVYNSHPRFRGQNYYKPIVFRVDDDTFIQMAATTITGMSLSAIFGGNPEITELVNSLDYFANKASKYEQVAFGGKAVNEFWKGKHHKKKTLYNVMR